MSLDPIDFEKLCHAVLEGAASEAQIAQFQRCLHEDATLREEYLVQMRLHALLSWQHGRASVAVKPAKVMRWASWRPALAMAAAAALLAGLAAWYGMTSSHDGVLLEIVKAETVPYVKGQRVSLHELRMESGILHFQLDSGVLVEATGPVEMQFVDAMHIRLMSGQVTADVGERGKGFVIDTPQAHVVDLGTRFGVDASDASHTDVVVFKGKVEIFEPLRGEQSSPQIASLVEGEALQVSAGGAKKRVSCVFNKGESGNWSRKPPPGALITDVHDSLEGGGSNHFYRVGVGALTAGSSLRQTHPLSWTTLDGSPLPEWLEGCDWVETGADEGVELDLQVTLARPAMLYVLRDSRQALPSWIRDNFIDTGTRLLMKRSSTRASGETKSPQLFTVWSMKVSQAGTVTLGPTIDSGQPTKGRRYRVAAKSLP
ncbi:hypothetical protein BH11VER1_BH11VER1_36580 [soil metagenome]